MPTVQQTRDTSKLFPRITALGSGTLHARHLATMSEAGLEAVVQLWRLMLMLAAIPCVIDLLLLLMLPKLAGGTRPIGLFPGLVRVLIRFLLHVYGKASLALHSGPYFFGDSC